MPKQCLQRSLLKGSCNLIFLQLVKKGQQILF